MGLSKKLELLKSAMRWADSLLLATCFVACLLLLARDDLAKHDDTVAIHKGHTRKALTVLEGVAHKRLLRCKRALSHLIGLERVGILHFLATGFLAHLPLEFDNAAGRAATAHKTNR